MVTGKVRRFPIQFDKWYEVLSSSLLLPPADSYVEIEGEKIYVRMAWAFQAKFPISAVTSVTAMGQTPLSRGVHGFGGKWLVNGSGQGILTIDLTPPQRAYVLGFPICLRQLSVSVTEPGALTALLRN